MIYEILKLAAEKPGCIFECISLLTAKLQGEVNEESLKQLVQMQYETAKAGDQIPLRRVSKM